MRPPHDAPSVRELLEAVREWLDVLVAEGEGSYRSFDARVASSIIAMVEREMLLGDGHERRHDERLASIGVRGDRELSDLIRRGDNDEHQAEVIRRILLEATADKLEVVSPRFVARYHEQE